jgi:hypothetical protein
VPADQVEYTNAGGVLAWQDLTQTFGDLVPGQLITITTVFSVTTGETDFSMLNEAETRNIVDEFGNSAIPVTSTQVLINSPTAIELLSFKAQALGDAILLTWITGLELNTRGFHLWRSLDANRAQASQITPNLILAQGMGGKGASYQFLDQHIDSQTNYSYWLQEIEMDDDVSEYGPITHVWIKLNQLYLPLFRK